MIFILISWLYILFITVGMGSLILNYTKIKNPVFLIVSGLFFQLILIHFWAIFFGVNLTFYCVNSLIAAGLIYFQRTKIKSILIQSVDDFKNWNPFLKFLFIFIGIATLMQSSVSPYLPDNESYYIQTIKWLNSYGLVKGLANLHLFFGQMSGWHMLQSSFNFGFLINFLNDLNGFLLVVISFFSFDRLNHFTKEKNLPDLFIGLIFTASVFLFRFLDAPSPDLPVFLIFPVMAWIFLNQFEKPDRDHILLLFVFGLLLTLSKITSFPVLILPIVLLIKSSVFKKTVPAAFLLCLIALIAFFSKNYIITGYLLNPTDLLGNLLNPDWKMPNHLQQLFYAYPQFHAYNSSPEEFENFKNWSQLTKFTKWFFSPKLHGIFNKLILILLIVFPFWIRKNKALFWIYITSLFQFLILYFTSPQYRFFFHIILVLGLIIIATILIKISFRNLKILLTLTVVPVLIPLVFNLNFKALTNNHFMRTQTKTFRAPYLFKPKKNSQYIYHYEKIIDGNLEYNSPVKTYMWLTGDGELPVANKIMINYIKKREGLRPQLRTGKLKDGFKSEEIKK